MKVKDGSLQKDEQFLKTFAYHENEGKNYVFITQNLKLFLI